MVVIAQAEEFDVPILSFSKLRIVVQYKYETLPADEVDDSLSLTGCRLDSGRRPEESEGFAGQDGGRVGLSAGNEPKAESCKDDCLG